MKKLLLLLLLILIGCSEPEPTDIETLNFRNDKYFLKNSDKPFSGEVFKSYPNGQYELYGSLKNGVPHGLIKSYFDNGQLEKEETFKDGMKMDPTNPTTKTDNSKMKEPTRMVN